MHDPQLEIRLWLARQLDKRGRGTRMKLAKLLGLEPTAVTRMVNTNPAKPTREIKAHELLSMQAFFGSQPPATAFTGGRHPLLSLDEIEEIEQTVGVVRETLISHRTKGRSQ